jgi:hypothetical protein
MHEGRARLGKSVKELMMHWAEARSHWDDSTSKAFERRFLIPIDMDSRKAITSGRGRAGRMKST